MNYDMFLFYGHGEGDCGACANGYKEVDLAKDLTKRVYDLLINKGVKVLTNLENGYNNYNRNLTSGHNIKYKMGCSIHFNSASETAVGSEIIIPCKETFYSIENEILNGLQSLGFTNRGIKSRDYDTEKWINRKGNDKYYCTDYYKEIRNAYSNGNSLSIIEVCFISNLEDIKRYNQNKDKIAKIIANAYLREMDKSLYSLEEPKKETSTIMYRVITGSFANRENAEKRIKELKDKGFDSFIEIRK